MYFTIKNLPAWFNTCFANKFLLCVGLSKDLYEDFYETMCNHVIDEIERAKIIKVATKDGSKVVPLYVTLVVGDNEGSISYTQAFISSSFSYQKAIPLQAMLD